MNTHDQVGDCLTLPEKHRQLYSRQWINMEIAKENNKIGIAYTVSARPFRSCIARSD